MCVFRKAIAGLIGVFWLMSPAFALPPVGQAAPVFQAIDSQGNRIHLSDFRGQTVVLEWTNHDCPFVRKHYETGNMQTLQKRARDENIIWLSVISSAPGKQGHVSGEGADKLTRKRGAAPHAVLLDEKGILGRLYEVSVTPQLYVIDAQGILVFAGAIDDQPSHRKETVSKAHNYVQAALDDLALGRKTRVSVKRPYGCSVKY